MENNCHSASKKHTYGDHGSFPRKCRRRAVLFTILVYGVFAYAIHSNVRLTLAPEKRVLWDDSLRSVGLTN